MTPEAEALNAWAAMWKDVKEAQDRLLVEKYLLASRLRELIDASEDYMGERGHAPACDVGPCDCGYLELADVIREVTDART